jgi:tripartite-type tricarboxylate transporter receptor subunit TctC
MARSNTPPDILKKLSAGMQEALQDPLVRQKIGASGDVPLGTTQEFQDFLNREHDRWGHLVKQAAIKPE